jgi:EAL domain-containing protein (putative c-di-GMP-specific phosphodiesterase class I)/DNA-binding response OmpR family regulator
MYHLLLGSERRTDLVLVEMMLGDAGVHPRVDWAPDYSLALQAYSATDGTCDACILDASLGGGRGIELLHAMSVRGARIPVIMLIAEPDPELELVLLQTGARAVLVRADLTSRLFERTVRHLVLRHRLDYTLDGTTGEAFVPARTACDRVEMAVLRARRRHALVACVVIDVQSLDDESIAHDDRAIMLHTLIERLRHLVGSREQVLRISNKEILICLEGFTELDVAISARADIEQALLRPMVLRNAPKELVMRIGMACYPDDCSHPVRLVSTARAAAMALVPRDRQTTIPISTGVLTGRSRREELRLSIRGAVQRGELYVLYQPQIDLRTNVTVGAEALVRWQHPHLGVIPPAEFVAIAEEADYVAELGRWVLWEACKQAKAWLDEGHPLRVSVNVSAQELAVGLLATETRRALATTGLPGDYLVIEITEGLLLENSSDTRAQLVDLRELGVRIAVDDFGTGYASLSYIKHFPMDVVKIDREFVRGLHLDNENAAITSSIVALGRCLGLEVIAEGVEEEAEEAFLRSLDCHIVQGYRYAQALTPAELYLFMLSRRDVPQSGITIRPRLRIRERVG